MMNIISKPVVLVSFIALSACGQAQGPDVQEGEWEVTYTTKMPGMTMPAATVRQCLTKEMLIPQQQEQPADCEVPKITVDGDTVSWEINCASSKGSGSVTYQGDQMSGTIKVNVNSGGMAFEMESEITGKRIGDCPL